MHTPNQGLTYTFKFSAVLIICSLYECSLPSVPFPLFPSLVPYQKQSVVFVTHTSPLLSKSVHSLPSSSSHCSLPSFPIDNHVPTLLSYFRLCSLSLFLIMPWHSLSLMSLCYFCKIVGNAILCSKYLSERTGQLPFMHKNYILKCHIILVQRSPLEIMGTRALKKMGARAP